MPGNNIFSKNFFLLIMFTLIVLSVFIIRPLFVSLIVAGILSYMFYPVYKFLAQKTRSRRLAAALIIIMLLIIIIVPSYFVVNSLTKEGYSLFITVKQAIASTDKLELSDCAVNPKPFCGLLNEIITIVKTPQVTYYLEDTISKVSTYIINKTSSFIINLPILVVDLFVMFFLIYYFLLDGTKFIEKAKNSIPLRRHHVDHIMNEFENFTYATLYGHLITALVQGVMGGLVYWFLGLTTPILAGIGMAFFAFIPFLGTPVIWLPTAITLLIAGETTKAIILLLLGTFLISTIDNIIRPEIIGNRVKLHPAAVLVGIIGGLFFMGPIGILLGPLVFSLLISFIDVYFKEGLGFEHS